MGRAPCCEKVGLKKGPWTAEEDAKLTAYIKHNGHGSWRALPKKAGLLRCGKSCRLRWTNYLRPDIKRGEFTASEEQTIIQLHALLGNRWSAIASHLPKRTDNEIKNYWNTHLKKRLLKMGIDPVTHKPTGAEGSSSGEGNATVGVSACVVGGGVANNHCNNSNHTAQWESVRLEAEARLAREAEMRAKGMWPPPTTGHQVMSNTCREWASTKHHNRSYSRNKVSGDKMCSSEQRRLCMMSSSAMELLNGIQNWRKPPTPEEDGAWLDSCYLVSTSSSSSASSLAAVAEYSSSCCGSSPTASAATAHQPCSPTSTLSSLDNSSLLIHKVNPPAIISSSATTSTSQFKKLSWTDTLLRPLPSSFSDHYCTTTIRDGAFQGQWRDGSVLHGAFGEFGLQSQTSSHGRSSRDSDECGVPASAGVNDETDENTSCGGETSFSSLKALMQIDEGEDAGSLKGEEEEEEEMDDRGEEDNEEDEEGRVDVQQASSSVMAEDISSCTTCVQNGSRAGAVGDGSGKEELGLHYNMSYSALLLNKEDDEYDGCDWNSMLQEADDPILSSID